MEQGRVREGTPPDEEAGPPGSCYMPTLLVSIARGVGRILSCVGRLRWYSKVYFSSEKNYFSSTTFTKVYFFSFNFKTTQITSLQLFKPCIISLCGFKGDFATVNSGFTTVTVVLFL